MRIARSGTLVCALWIAARAAAQPVGGEFRVNTYTTKSQNEPGAAMAPGGRFFLVWRSNPEAPNASSLRGRVFSSSGAPIAPDFEIASATSGQFLSYGPEKAAVAADGADRFYVVWDIHNPVKNYDDVHARRFDIDGNALGAEFLVNTNTDTNQYAASVAADQYGNFVVAWTGGIPGEEIFARRFDSTGVPIGENFRVNTYATGDQLNPSVAMQTQGGSFLIAWQSNGQDGNAGGIYARAFEGNGTPAGPEFPVNSSTTGDDSAARAAAWDGGFIVVWNRNTNGGTVLMRRFTNLSGFLPAGPELQVTSQIGFGTQYDPAVAADHHGDFVVTWSRTGYPNPVNSGELVFAQRYNEAGQTLGEPFRVNTATVPHNNTPTVAANGGGDFVVAWESYRYGAPSRRDVFAQRFGPIARFGDANGDGTTNVSDVLFLINNLFAGGAPPVGPADANGDGVVNVSDILYLINHLFAGGPPPK